MYKPLSVLVLSALLLSGCGGLRESRVNPLNWFGNSTPQRTTVRSDDEVNTLIPPQRRSIFRASGDDGYAGVLVDNVTELHVEPRPGGALIRAVGVTRYQGPFEVKLVKVEEASTDGVLVYDLRALQYRNTVGTAASRSIQAAVWVTDSDLAGVHSIQVRGSETQRTARR